MIPNPKYGLSMSHGDFEPAPEGKKPSFVASYWIGGFYEPHYAALCISNAHVTGPAALADACEQMLHCIGLAAREDTDRVARAMSTMRVGAVDLEKHLYPKVESALVDARIAHRPEVVLGPRCRIDFLCERGIGIEVKKGKITGDQARAQLARYAATRKLRGLVFVVERYAFKPDEIVADIPVAYVALHRLHGVAL